MKKQIFKPKLLVVLIAGMGLCDMAVAANDTVPASTSAQAEATLSDVEVEGRLLTTDQKGEAAVFSKNVSNAYVGREYLERFRADSAGDILKGLNGVYNMNTRTAGGAITPNIRGVAGKGRIPVTIDGTEQTVDVWLNNYGVGDRNYVDPALFRSIGVEKSPSMTRGMKSGVGGSIAIRTIEPEDIIPEGKKWGIEVKTQFSNNTAEPRTAINDYLGKDYRTLPGNPTADRARGMLNGKPFSSVVFNGKESDKPRTSNGISDFKNDRENLISAAFKTDLADGLIAFSKREKGNYFSGKSGFSGYLGNPDPNDEYDSLRNTSAAMIPNMAKLYRPGEEVPNSNVATKSLLLKNNWYLPNNQKISLQYMNNDITFGELNPFYNALLLGFSNDYNMQPGQAYTVAPVQGLNSHIDSKTYKIGYEWKPENSKWIDLQANVWRVHTESTRHQSAGPDLSVLMGDFNYDNWVQCNLNNQIPPNLENYNMSCDQLVELGIVPKEKPDSPEPIPGAYKVFSGAEQTTIATRTGADISNRFRLRDNLSLTIAANTQYEKLDESNQMAQNDRDLFAMMNAATLMTKFAGPRGGRRHEWGAQMTFDWQPAERLSIQAGLRYDKFWAFDDATARGRRERKDPYYALDMNGGYPLGQENGYKPYVITGVRVPYFELADKNRHQAELAALEEARAGAMDWQVFEEKYGYNFSYANRYDGNGQRDDNGALYLPRFTYSPFRNGRYQGPLFETGQWDKQVDNPQNLSGKYFQYLQGVAATLGNGNGSDRGDYLYWKEQSVKMDDGSGMPGHPRVYKYLTEDERWPEIKRIRAQAWSPMLAFSYQLGDNGRLFGRWARAVRFPSIYEATAISTAGFSTKQMHSPEFDLKPERSTNWEVGYAFNFTPYWSKLRQGDVRLTYYNHQIKNVIDNTEDKTVFQYDKKISTGIELQSRIDTGRYFAALGATYRLKQTTCDKGVAFVYDVYGNRAPECVEGGFGATRFYQSLQPKYSINLDVGTRLLGEKLELGMRGIYHSDVKNKGYDRIASQGYHDMLVSTGQPYRWRASLVLDMYGRYNFNKNISMNFGVGNLTNRYYLDPMSNVPTPGPGRTVTLGIKGKF